MWASAGCATIGARTPSTSSRTAECFGSSRSGASRSSIVAASEGTLPVCLRAWARQQVADLGEQDDVLGLRLGLGLLAALAALGEHVERPDHHEEDHRGHDQE